MAALARSTFRCDATVQDVNRILHDRGGLRMLDCGCDNGILAEAIRNSGVALHTIQYFGIDVSEARINSVRDRERQGDYSSFGHFEVRVREIIDMDGYPREFFDLIVVNNILHEIWPTDISSVLSRLNTLLDPKVGQLSIVDMEVLPDEDREPWAIMWRGDEVLALLAAGGFRPSLTQHSKRVPVFRVVTGSASPIVQTDEIKRFLPKVIEEKHQRLIRESAKRRVMRDISEDSCREALALRALAVALFELHGAGHEQ